MVLGYILATLVIFVKPGKHELSHRANIESQIEIMEQFRLMSNESLAIATWEELTIEQMLQQTEQKLLQRRQQQQEIARQQQQEIARQRQKLYVIWNDVDMTLNELGAIAFNTPESINIEDSPQIQLILSLTETVEQLKKSITEKGKKIGATIEVNERMEARLSGSMFEITAITSEIQAISKNQQTEWKWEVCPKKKGQHKLYLTLTAFLESERHTTPRTIKTFTITIEVNVTATQEIDSFFGNNWQWLWAAILVPVVGWLWKRGNKQLPNTSS